ncbi:PAP2 family protein [Oesophagostomum dentatum]|uniref:PAP2 family protein n=1 Tax=Oesophagostomum dentatum TaxID=61180 RepID=A0A0B1T5J0_OESDE|nr:PAP2 family protein [Oesophagostomum dentatum]
MIGLVCVFVLTNVTKSCVGRLRPHFLDVCKPLNITCQRSEYYSNYTCTGDPLRVEEARKSFFSGHSSIAMYASTFTALYLLARMPRHSTGRVLVPISQTALLATGLLISLSRINDNKHHWSDVIVGIFVGVSAAIYTCPAKRT